MEGQIKYFSNKVKLKKFIITKLLLYEMLNGFIWEKEDQNWTVKWQQTHNYQQLKEKNKKQKLSKQLEQEQNHRNEDHMEGYQWGWEGGEREKR